jgi:hypothetical protein
VSNRQSIKTGMYSLSAGRQNAEEASIRDFYEGTGIRISPHRLVEHEEKSALEDIITKDGVKVFSLKIYFCVDLSLNRQIHATDC